MWLLRLFCLDNDPKHLQNAVMIIVHQNKGDRLIA